MCSHQHGKMKAKVFRRSCSRGYEFIWTSAAFLAFLLGGITFLPSPVLIIIELVCECWCWETYSGCCSLRSHAVTPGERETGREKARGRWTEWINQQMSLLISQQYNDVITQNSDLLISRRPHSTSFLKLTGRISVTLGAESLIH